MSEPGDTSWGHFPPLLRRDNGGNDIPQDLHHSGGNDIPRNQATQGPRLCPSPELQRPPLPHSLGPCLMILHSLWDLPSLLWVHLLQQ